MKEHDIRPDALLSRYIELSARDAQLCFSNTERTGIPCVACSGTECVVQFTKEGFTYSRCTNCGTLYQTPRPSIEAFEAFYRESESSKYWAETFFPAVAEARREKIFRPRVERLLSMCEDESIEVDTLIDVGAGYGIFLEEWCKLKPGTSVIAVEPSASLAEECRAKRLQVIEDMVENMNDHSNCADLVTCFEVLEHVYSPIAFLQQLVRLARPGGYVFVSTLGIDGFDLQVLWDRSSQIFPPHHINFLSIDGFAALFQRAGLENVSITTPGKLDVDIVRNAVKKDPELIEGNRFLVKLLEDRYAESFQKYLVEQKLSSHVWVIGRKPLDGSV